MTENKSNQGTAAKIVRNPLLYFIIGYSILGVILTFVFKRIELEGATASAWQVANFLILITALYFFAKDPLKEYLAKRRETISGSINEAVKARADLEQSSDDYEYKMEWIEDEITGIESKLWEEGQRERERLIEEAQKQIERIKNETEFTARQELKAAEAKLKDEAIRNAIQVAQEILKTRLNDEDEKKLVEEYLQEVSRGGQN